MRPHEKLDVWKKAINFGLSIYEETADSSLVTIHSSRFTGILIRFSLAVSIASS